MVINLVSMRTPVRLHNRDLAPHKATTVPLLDARTVLTRSPWEFVSLWLKRNRREEALFYWNQARRFADASAGLPVQSSPLLHYYSFLNATKALLSAKGVPFREDHGVTRKDIRGTSKRIELANEGIKIKTGGVLPALASSLGDTEVATEHTLQEILFNLPFVHRTYCLTYRSQKDLFFALSECVYVFDRSTGDAYLTAKLSPDFAHPRFIRRLPASFIPDPLGTDARSIRSAASVSLTRPELRSDADLAAIASLNRQLRTDLQYIAGTQTLWYVKVMQSGPKRLNRSPLTLALAAMHRLSEICRYRPLQLAAFLDGPRNWLLSEFALMAPEQFLDGIASELTGHQFLLPNVRSPS